MKSLCFVALSLTICWPVATPDVSGGALGPKDPPCTGHLAALKCEELNGATCKDVPNIFKGGFSPLNIKDHIPNETVVNHVYCDKVEGNSINCSGSGQKAVIGCAGVVKDALELPL